MFYVLSASLSAGALFRVPEEYVGRRNLECVETLHENPLNPRQVLIGYSRGLMVLWDLDRRCAIQHFLGTQVFLNAVIRAWCFVIDLLSRFCLLYLQYLFQTEKKLMLITLTCHA